MDIKACETLNKYYNAFLKNDFDELIIPGFFNFIREYIPNNSLLKELCHFFAHRERDKGITLDYIIKLNNYINFEKKLPLENVTCPCFFEDSKIVKELNQFFISNGYNGLNISTYKDIIICMISLLQEIPLCKNKEIISRLYVNIDYKSIGLYANLDATPAFTIHTNEGVSKNVKFTVPIMVLYFLPTSVNYNSYNTSGNPIRLERENGRLRIILKTNMI